MLGSRIRTATSAASITLLAAALIAPGGVAAKDGGNGKHAGHPRKAAMQVCKKGGWRTVEKEDGTRFRNQGRCVRYLVRGGTVTPIEPAVTIEFVASGTVQGACDATGVVADLAADRTLPGELVVGDAPPTAIPVTTDASGEGTASLGAYPPGAMLVFSVGAATSGSVAAGCEFPQDN
jgi:hypothetical protein